MSDASDKPTQGASVSEPWSDEQVQRLWALQAEARRHGFRLYTRNRPGAARQIMFGDGELTDQPYPDLDAVAAALAEQVAKSAAGEPR